MADRKQAAPELAAVMRNLVALARERGAYSATLHVRVDLRADVDLVWPDLRHQMVERWDEVDGEIVQVPLRIEGGGRNA
jgi:hypothetical protein